MQEAPALPQQLMSIVLFQQVKGQIIIDILPPHALAAGCWRSPKSLPSICCKSGNQGAGSAIALKDQVVTDLQDLERHQEMFTGNRSQLPAWLHPQKNFPEVCLDAVQVEGEVDLPSNQQRSSISDLNSPVENALALLEDLLKNVWPGRQDVEAVRNQLLMTSDLRTPVHADRWLAKRQDLSPQASCPCNGLDLSRAHHSSGSMQLELN